jgi:WhiB family redox-sensing transcriptional regulator
VSRWWERAACKGQLHLFFPRNGQFAKARAICATCPVQAECLAEALEVSDRGELHGLWAGLNKQEREQITGRHYTAWWKDGWFDE